MLKSQELQAKLLEVKNSAKDLTKSEEITAKISEIEDIKAQISLAEMQENEERLEAEKNTTIQNKNKDGVVKMDKMIIAKAISGSELTAEEQLQIKNLVLEGDRTKGGVAIPSDITTDIKEYQDATRMFDIRNYLTIEPVSTLKGSRPYAVNQPQASGFASVDEGADIQALYEPTFDELSYIVRKYAGFIPLSNELLADSVANIYAYIVKWLAENELNSYAYQTLNGTGVKSSQGIMTEATTAVTGKLLTRTDKITTPFASPQVAIKKFKTTFNVDLETVVGDNIKIFTNADGYDYLDGLTDAQGKGYLQPDATKKSGFSFLGREIVKMPKKFLENVIDGANTLTPFIVGDLKQLYTMYDREQMSVASTNIGGSTWRNDTTELKGIFRFDGKLQVQNTQCVKILLVKLV
jgi:HK97 family phage major capsid protein